MFIVLLYLLWLVVKFYLKKKTDLIGFFKIKPRHPDEQKNRSGWKNQRWEPCKTIGLIITSGYRIKLIKIKGFVTSQKTFVSRNKFLHVKVAGNTTKVGQACCKLYT